METWFTSDTHFGHKNILVYEKESRPFSCIEEMNEALIDNWNKIVGINDKVYHLGDFCFGKDNIAIAGRLNGIKHLIMGNHDTYDIHLYLKYFKRVFGVLFWKNCILSHIPVHPDNLGSRAFLNIHGHLHSKRVFFEESYENQDGCFGRRLIDSNYYNVSVELHQLKPVNSELILQTGRIKRI